MKDCNIEYQRWRENIPPADPLYEELARMEGKPEEIYEAFYKELKFGTAGLRGTMAAGTNRMNVPVVERATQGLADYINRQGEEHPSVVIGYDSRNHSEEFARCTAKVLAANDIDAHLFARIMPVSAVSFAVRHMATTMGIMITASHNPKEYNGYKVYDDQGIQILADVAEQVLACIQKVDIFQDVKRQPKEGRLHQVGEDVCEAYVTEAVCCSPNQKEDVSNLKVVYTPLNGTGLWPVTTAWQRIGLTKIFVVPEQEQPDGNFPSCPSPNPEIPKVYELGATLCDEKGADLVIATDPDCDRMGIAVRKGDGFTPLTGNQIGVLLFDYICRHQKLPKDPVAVRSIVSTPQIDPLAQEKGIQVRTCLIGFKYIGEIINEDPARYVFGFEEGNGYLAGDFVRDKDGVSSAVIAVQMAAEHKRNGKTLLAALEEISRRTGYYKESVLSFEYEGSKGAARMQELMERLREEKQAGIFEKKAIHIVDYLEGEQYSIGDASRCEMVAGTRPTDLPRENILEFGFEDNSRIIIRPSGTEPKIKAYLFARGEDKETAKRIILENRQKVRELLRNE